MSLPVSYLMNRGTGTEGETFEPHTILDLKAAFILLRCHAGRRDPKRRCHSTLIVRAVNPAPNGPCVTPEHTAQSASLHPACNLSLAKAVLRKPT